MSFIEFECCKDGPHDYTPEPDYDLSDAAEPDFDNFDAATPESEAEMLADDLAYDPPLSYVISVPFGTTFTFTVNA